MMYNLSNINTSSMVQMTQGVNEILMYGSLGILILVVLSFIIFSSLTVFTRNVRQSAGLTSLFAAVFAIFLRNMNIISDQIVLVTWVIAAIMAALSVLMPE